MLSAHRALSLSLLLLLTLTLVSAPALDNPNIPIVKPDPVDFPVNMTVNVSVNSSLNWDTGDHGSLRNVGDILHGWLSNLGWSVAGHFFDIDVNFNGYDIYNITNVNATAGWFTTLNTTTLNATDIYVSNTSIFLGDTIVLSANGVNGSVLNVSGGNVSAEAYFGSGEFLTDLNLSGISFEGDTINATIVNTNISNSLQFNGGNFTGQNFTGANAFFSFYNWTASFPWLIFNGSNLEFNSTQLITSIAGTFNQSLNTSDNVTFNSIKIGDILPLANASIDIQTDPANVSQEVCADTAACYRFEEGEGVSAFDESGNGNNGLLRQAGFAASKGTNGTGNFSLILGGNTSSYGYVPSTSTLQQIDNFSVSVWVFRDTGNLETIVSKRHDTVPNNGWMIDLTTNNRVRFITLDNSVYARQRTPTNTLTSGAWHHIVAIKSSGVITIYVDSVLQSTSATSTNLVGPSKALLVGINSDLTTHTFTGRIDELAIFNKVLNSTEVTSLFNDGFLLVTQNVSGASSDMLSVGTSERPGEGLFVEKDFRVGIRNPTPTFVFDVNGSQRIEGTLFVENDVIVQGSLLGGSPVKIVGGLDVRSGNLEVSDNVSVNNTITSQEFVDLTTAYPRNESEAIEDLKRISSQSDGKGGVEVNHTSYPAFVQRIVEYQGVMTEGRSIGSLVSMLIEAVKGINTKVDAQQQEIDLLKSEICRLKNESQDYAWCPGIGK